MRERIWLLQKGARAAFNANVIDSLSSKPAISRKPRVYPCQNALWSHFSNHYPLYTLVFVITAPLYMRCRIINHIKLLESVAAKHIYNAIS